MLRDWFSGFDDSVPPQERIRPGAFGLLGHPLGLVSGITTVARPARGYEPNPAGWEQGPWYDRRTGTTTRITTLSPGDDPERFAEALASGAVKIQRLGEVLARYRIHPEHKSVGPDRRWADEVTRGLLRRRPVFSAPVLTDLIGKEGNKITERLTGEVEDPGEYRVEYGGRADRWRTLALPVLRQMRDEIGTEALSRRVGVHRRSIERVLGPTLVVPHASMRARYLDGASDWCRRGLADLGVQTGHNPLGTIWCHLRRAVSQPAASCTLCGRPLSHPLALYCGATCKKRGYRKRRRVRAS